MIGTRINFRTSGRTVSVAFALLVFGTAAQAGTKMYDGSLTIHAFGNDLTGGTGASEFYLVIAMPWGVHCSPNLPASPYSSTAVTAKGAPKPLGSFCSPVAYLPRPASGSTPVTPMGARGTPVHRNPGRFTSLGLPKTTFCTGLTLIGFIGKPLTGSGSAAIDDGGSTAGFTIPQAATATTGPGMRRITSGSFGGNYPYIYSYTYADLRNDAGNFSAGNGPGSFSVPYIVGGKTAMTLAKNTAGSNQFGGVMKLLGTQKSKACYYRNGGRSIGPAFTWLYWHLGATPYYSTGGDITQGGLTTATAMGYHTNLMLTSTWVVQGSHFPWTTGMVTLTAKGPTRPSMSGRATTTALRWVRGRFSWSHLSSLDGWHPAVPSRRVVWAS